MAHFRLRPCLRRLAVVIIILTVFMFILAIRSDLRSVDEVFENRTGNEHADDEKWFFGMFSALKSVLRLFQKVSGNALPEFGVNNTVFRQKLKDRSLNSTIVLSSVDSGYLDMAINLYFTSFKKFNIENYLFVGSDPDVCHSLSALNITCYDYIHDRDGRKASAYFSQAFKRKTHLKTKIVLEALKLGLNVLITDVDIVFLKNPLPTFTCHSCDIEISSDVTEANSGFYFARPTAAAIKLHETTWRQGLTMPKKSNQKILDANIAHLQQLSQIEIKNLDPEIYVNGKVYFEDGKRMFKGDNPCSKCVIVHNNWIVTAAAKILRFKECGLWENDRNHYYSSEVRKYLTFDLPNDYGRKETTMAEKRALQNALIIGEILNRTVILPKFHCYGCKYNEACKKPGARCSLGTFYKIEAFDSQLKDRYRESVFLSHDKVPVRVRRSRSPAYFIKSREDGNDASAMSRDSAVVEPKDANGATLEEVMAWFGGRNESVLRFHSLYGVLRHDVQRQQSQNILRRVEKAFVKTDYRQIV